MSRIVARLAGACLILAFGMSPHASPKSYDVDCLLRQPAPDWLHPPTAAAQVEAAPPAYAPHPLDRIPRIPAPTVLPEDGALTVPPPLPAYEVPPCKQRQQHAKSSVRRAARAPPCPAHGSRGGKRSLLSPSAALTARADVRIVLT